MSKLKLERRKHKKTKKHTLHGSAEIKQSIELSKVVAIGVVVLVMVLAVGNYALSMMQQTGVGNQTIYKQGQQMLYNIESGYGNVVNIALLAIIITALAVVIYTVERW